MPPKRPTPRSRSVKIGDNAFLSNEKTKNTQSAKLKRVFDELREQRHPISAAHLSKTMQAQLHNNPRVAFIPQDNTFVYKPIYNSVLDKDALLQTLVNAWPAPCLQPDLEDAYKNAFNDLQELRKEYSDVIWTVRHPTNRVEQWYCSPNALKQHTNPVILDGYQNLTEEEKSYFSEMWTVMGDTMPRIEDIENSLDKMGVKPMTSVAFKLEEYRKQRQIEEYRLQKKGSRKRKRNLKVTNVHMQETEDTNGNA
mmetsp:Transcript_217/g.725  ORF Transcript_217/g.725 Transcript_217/m.725 type:complete len:253 (-) Transcript_217:96-854(-)|eukprot:CAMPEP_0117446456 /NCGR_PEP_ID=MMETSP0759-20121206/6350_1 /TAXON_ID=63605 /ORGANISM="Percolomonas cosmopolitus, Strain WS" /LENGTH=252 /DNA_ID=CAMNT_0005238723 /DNA_START=99 /DNA_END=857 /DNA_ORIENTATION=-